MTFLEWIGFLGAITSILGFLITLVESSRKED
jgi:hypothetical protein